MKIRYLLENTQHVKISEVEPGGIMTKYLELEEIEGTNNTSLLLSYPIIGRSLYSGLKDKNNKEIFEGDIVSMYLPPMKKTVYVEVKFKDGIFYPFGQKGDLDGNYAWESVDCEIAGNIFENPDLIGPPKSN